MKELKEFSMDELVDKLAYYTREHTRLMRENSRGNEFENCKVELKKISKEINLRREQTGKSVPGEN